MKGNLDDYHGDPNYLGIHHAYECRVTDCDNYKIELRRKITDQDLCDLCGMQMRDLGGPPFDSERPPDKRIRPALEMIREGFHDLGFDCQDLDGYGIGVLGFKIPLNEGQFVVKSWVDLMSGVCVDVLIKRSTTKTEDGSSLHFTKRFDG